MTEAELEKAYKGYLNAVNAGRFHQLSEFIAEEADFNGRKVSPRGWDEYIAYFSDRCEKGLHFELLDLVIDAEKGKLASKLIMTGKPVKEFFGMEPNGETISFNEVHDCCIIEKIGFRDLRSLQQAAFYHFEKGKIVRVRTIVDRGDIADGLVKKS